MPTEPTPAERLYDDPAVPAPPPISVIVCTKDRPELLAGCLSALAEVEYPEYEVVVVDNGSRDDHARALAELHGARGVREERPGLDRARNRGIRESRHDIVAFVDDDVRVEPTWLSALARAFADPEVTAVTGQVLPLELETPAQRLFEAYGNGMSKGPEPRRFSPGALTAEELIAVQHVGVGANMAARRSVLLEVGGFDPALDVGTPAAGAGDLDLFHRLLVAGETIHYEPAAAVRHRHRRDMPELEAQIHANGRSFGVYLLKLLRDRTVPTHAVVLYGLTKWAPWLTVRWVRGLLGRHRLPVRLLWAELRGALGSPAAFLSTYRSAGSPSTGESSIEPSASEPNASK